MTDRVCKEFPKISREIVVVALEAHEYNESQAKETLKMQFPNETSSPRTQPSVSKTQPRLSHPQPPVMSKLTQAKKNKVKNKLKSEFPGVTEIELNTAVQVTDYNESMARDLL
jgi:hypothetical protein